MYVCVPPGVYVRVCVCVAAVVSIVSRRGLGIGVHCRNQCNRSKLAMYSPLLSL